MTELDYSCPVCGCQPGYRHNRTCDSPCRISRQPMTDCKGGHDKQPHRRCSPAIWCPPTTDGLIAVALVEDDPMLVKPCSECHEYPVPGNIVLLPPSEAFLFHLDCLTGLAKTLVGLIDPRRTREVEARETFQANKAALIAYLQRTLHDH